MRNEGGILPLTGKVKKIAVIGPNADNVMNQLGDYSPHKVLQHVTTILEGIKAKAGPGVTVTGVKGCRVSGEDKSGFAEAVAAAKNADVADCGGGGKRRAV